MVFFEKHGGVEEKEFFRYFSFVNDSFPLHFHRAYELVFVEEGELLLTIDQNEYRLKKNDLAFIFNHQMHEFKTITQSNITIILFSPELIGHFFSNYKGYIPKNNLLHLHKAPNLTAIDTIYSQKSFLYYLCSLLIDNTEFLPVEYSTKTKVLHKILLYVDQHYFQECTLKAVAAHLKYDYPYLSKLFAQMTNMSFSEYLNQYRISQACYLLKNSQQSIGEIANQCGYQNLRTFHRNFKKITNQPPRTYRDMGAASQ
ncbi:transcriptional regulator [Gracilibacillus boraciitolerans JCM 21714]|uniref:Transcriptional regulator n=1 Tax=Gracilibacillus boraciitolerans JCM 21714 TaxID=1298598 RepID=W4VM97_9BACI|nr:helix-turn-helix domain-containing protein [Gracilibacillus boraciitolerans]GAE94495.1 transcriptional regulator [Gracilibacillus boraciitolerans JCM 21714]